MWRNAWLLPLTPSLHSPCEDFHISHVASHLSWSNSLLVHSVVTTPQFHLALQSPGAWEPQNNKASHQETYLLTYYCSNYVMIDSLLDYSRVTTQPRDLLMREAPLTLQVPGQTKHVTLADCASNTKLALRLRHENERSINCIPSVSPWESWPVSLGCEEEQHQ